MYCNMSTRFAHPLVLHPLPSFGTVRRMANVREDYIKQSASLSIRLRPAELDKIKALAKKAKKTIAEFVRERCLNGK